VSGIENLACGLHIVGTERHEARRIDNQLRGRSGRQGDPGSSRFFLSLEDDLMRIFMGPWVLGFMSRAGFSEGQQIESAMVSRAIGRAQHKVEQFNFEMRKHVLEYDEVMDQQRKVLYGMRQKVLDSLVPIEVRPAVERLAERFIAEELRNAPELELVTRRTFEPLQKQVETFGVHLTEEQWLQCDEAAFGKIIKDGADPKKVKLGHDRLREWVAEGLGSFIDENNHPSAWQLGVIAEWARRHGASLAEKDILAAADKTATDLVVDKAVEAATGQTREDYLRRWVAAALITDVPTLANSDTWDYSHVRQWADKLGLNVPVAEWDPISRKRDKQEALLLEKAIDAFGAKPLEEVVRQTTPLIFDLYVKSPLFMSDARAERIALWAQRRLDAAISTAEMQQVFAGLKDDTIDRIFREIKTKLDAAGDAAAGDLALMSVERYLAEDLSADDRNIVGLAAAFEERYSVKLPVFDLSRMSYPELIGFLVGRVPPEIKYEIDAETVENMVMEMINNSIDRAIEQFVDYKADPNAFYLTVRDWLEPFGYTIVPDEWDGLTLIELRHMLAIQARKAHADDTKDEAVDKLVRAAVNRFLSSPLFAGEKGYTSLAAWAQTQFCFGICTTIEADIRKVADKRKADLRQILVEEKTAAYKAVTDDPAQAARELIGEVADVYIEAASGDEDFDESRIADWASKAFKLTLSRAELEERLEAGEQGIKDYVIGMAAAAYARRSVEKAAGDAVDAILDMCTSSNFIETWDYDKLGDWVKRGRLPINFDVDAFEDDTREAILGYFVNLAKEGYKDRAKEEVVPRVAANAASVLVECELSAEGRNYNALAMKMNQKFNLGLSSFRLSKMKRDELEKYLHGLVARVLVLRKRQLGKYSFLRSVSALLLHALDTRWKDHLYAMDSLKAGIGLRGYAGIDPKDAYKKEGFEMFSAMLTSAEENVSDLAMKVYFDDEESKRVAARRETAAERYVHEEAASFDKGRQAAADAAGKGDGKPAPIRAQKMPGRNDPCPCGKKKPDGTPVKYKNCCMKK